MQPINESMDIENKWKSSKLFGDFNRYLIDNNLVTPEMKSCYAHLYKLNAMTWLAIPV